MSAFADLEDVDRATFLVLVLDEEGEPSGIGTGFFVTEQGHVVTNEHVVSEGDNYVLIGGGDFDRKTHLARLVWSDEKLDLALLKTINAMTPSPPVLPHYPVWSRRHQMYMRMATHQVSWRICAFPLK